MAMGLPPLPPRWMPTRTRGPASPSSRPSPSSVPNCRSGSAPLCCTAAVPATDTTAEFLLALLGAPPSEDHGFVAITCAHLRRGMCAHQVVCCDHDDFDGVIATGCVLRPA
ncbi:hypothetical protein FB451DRAFT_1246750 [Mycena latifolia]|nr:hypothetical protein FB451DRAFT_1246750 [Mycena latifolia]